MLEVNAMCGHSTFSVLKVMAVPSQPALRHSCRCSLLFGYEILSRSDISYPSWPCSSRFRFQFAFIFQWPSSPVQNIMSGPRQLYQPKARYQFEFLHVLQQSRTEANVYTEPPICYVLWV